MISYRDRGAVGALLDEYEKALKDLIEVVSTISRDQLIEIIDTETTDEDCRSIQTILTHVLRAGYYYADAVRAHQEGTAIKSRPNYVTDLQQEYIKALQEMFVHTMKLFDDYPKMSLEEYDDSKKIKARWGQSYDVEQLMEHAIVHVLRHRRQIERFVLKEKGIGVEAKLKSTIKA